MNARIAVTGQVQDEQGEPLDQVRLHVRKNRVSLLPESFLSSTESSLELTDGRFEVTCRSCSSMNLSFSRDGYYSEEKSFKVGTESRPGNRIADEVAVDVVYSGVDIVLRDSRGKARLVTYRSLLTSTAEGPLTIAPLRRGLGLRVKRDRLSEPLGSDERNLPGFVQLVAAVAEAGTLAIDDSNARVPIAEPPKLDFAEADGGVVLYRYESGAPRDVYRSMRVAPNDGYQDSLLLDGDEPRGGNFYFFCRIGDNYGKGRITTPWLDRSEDGQPVVAASVEIRLNLDGSRNVETAF